MAGLSARAVETSAFDLLMTLRRRRGSSPSPQLSSNHAQLAAAGGAAAATPHTHAHAQTRRQAFEANTPSPRRAARAANPPRTHDKTAGASWVLTSLIREASLGVGLGVVFGAVWSTMQTGPVSKRIVEYYKNNPTQS